GSRRPARPACRPSTRRSARRRRRRSSRSSSVLLPYRDVLRALVGERRAIPVGPALAELETGEPCHEVELARPHVAARHRETLRTGLVMRDEALLDEVVLVDADVVVAHGEGHVALAGRKAPEAGNLDLDDEAPARLEVRCGGGERRHLPVLARDVDNRAVDEVDE